MNKKAAKRVDGVYRNIKQLPLGGPPENRVGAAGTR